MDPDISLTLLDFSGEIKRTSIFQMKPENTLKFCVKKTISNSVKKTISSIKQFDNLTPLITTFGINSLVLQQTNEVSPTSECSVLLTNLLLQNVLLEKSASIEKMSIRAKGATNTGTGITPSEVLELTTKIVDN